MKTLDLLSCYFSTGLGKEALRMVWSLTKFDGMVLGDVALNHFWSLLHSAPRTRYGLD